MSVVNPLPKEKAASELHPIFDGVSKKFGKMPNIFGLMAPGRRLSPSSSPSTPPSWKAGPWKRATKS